MLEYFRQNPLQLVILAALAALTVFVCLRAAAASKKNFCKKIHRIFEFHRREDIFITKQRVVYII